MSSYIDPWGALPEEDRARAKLIYGALRNQMESWIDERMEGLREHVLQEAAIKADSVAAELETALRRSVESTEQELLRLRESWEAISRTELSPDAREAAAKLETAIRTLEKDTKKRRDELKTWGGNFAKIALTAVKAAVAV